MDKVAKRRIMPKKALKRKSENKDYKTPLTYAQVKEESLQYFNRFIAGDR